MITKKEPEKRVLWCDYCISPTQDPSQHQHNNTSAVIEDNGANRNATQKKKTRSYQTCFWLSWGEGKKEKPKWKMKMTTNVFLTQARGGGGG